MENAGKTQGKRRENAGKTQGKRRENAAAGTRVAHNVTGCRVIPDISGGLAFLEHRGLEPVPLQQLVELGSIAFGE
jgi:hypothetical protein